MRKRLEQVLRRALVSSRDTDLFALHLQLLNRSEYCVGEIAEIYFLFTKNCKRKATFQFGWTIGDNLRLLRQLHLSEIYFLFKRI